MKNGVVNIRKSLFLGERTGRIYLRISNIRRMSGPLFYTTNTIEGFNRQLRKVTKNKGVFPIDDSLVKMLYLAMIDITKKWTGKRREWRQIHSQLEIFFADRLPDWHKNPSISRVK